MRTRSYPSGVTDARRALIVPHPPAPPGGGRPVKTALRDVADAIPYVLRAGRQWRPLPKDFPPEPTVWRCFHRWRRDGTPDAAHGRLRKKVRAAEKPYRPRAAASVDGQPVGGTPGGEQRGRDGAKDVGGRERRTVVGGVGSLLAEPVTAAGADGGRAARAPFARPDGQPVSEVRTTYADAKCHGRALCEWVRGDAHRKAHVARRPEGEGGARLPTRRAVGRTFAWPGRCRRLSKGREKSAPSSEAFVRPAMTRLMLNRLEPKGTDAEFHYRLAA